MRTLTCSGWVLFFIFASSVPVLAKAEMVRTYYPSGATKAEFVKENGKLNGPFKWYYQDGALGALLTYRNNQLHGISQTYYENGGVKKQVIMKENRAVGLSHYFTPEGRIEKSTVNQGGRELAQWIYGENNSVLRCEDVEHAAGHAAENPGV